MSKNKIVPSLWFNADKGQLSALLSYYKTIFGEAFTSGSPIPLGETPSGNMEMCTVQIFGQDYFLMNSEHEHHPLNDALSFIINCDNQSEIDHFWEYFSKEGKAQQCGWCTDKYGLRWQILPKNLNELMGKPGAMDVMLSQKKIIIKAY